MQSHALAALAAASSFVVAPRVSAAQAELTRPFALLAEGDTLSNGRHVTEIDSIELIDDGRWVAVVDTDGPLVGSKAVVRNGVVLLQLGQASPRGNGTTVNHIWRACINEAGQVAIGFQESTPQTGLTWIAMLGGQTAFVGGQVLVDPRFPTGLATVGSVSQIDLGEDGSMLGFASLDLGGGVIRSAVLLRRAQPGGVLGATEVVLLQGELVPGTTFPMDHAHLGADTGGLANATRAAISYQLDDPASVIPRRTLHVGGVAVAVDGLPSLVPGRLWDNRSAYVSALNEAGDHAFIAALDDFSDVVVKNGTVLARDGDPVPSLPGATFAVNKFAGIRLDGQGSVVWYGGIVGLGPSTVDGWFRDLTPLVVEGVTPLDGQPLDTLRLGGRTMTISRDGRLAALADRDAQMADRILGVELDLGVEFCTAAPNSTGGRGRTRVAGTSFVVVNHLFLQASGLPPSSFGYFIGSRNPGFVAHPGGSAGNLCLAPDIGRFGGQIFSSGATGSFEAQLDVTAFPQPTGPVAVVAGQTWGFQAWHRDSAGGVATSNFSRAVRLTFR